MRRAACAQGQFVKRATSILFAILGFSMPSQSDAADLLCRQLETFIKDQEAEVADPMPRHWVEFHWGIDPDPNSIWSWGCRHSADQSSKQLCGWLMDHTSRELRDFLPLRIQQCMGYRLPKQAWSGWHISDGMIEHQRRNGSWLVMEIVSQGLQRGESAVRISYNTVDRRFETDELQQVQPLRESDGFRVP